MNTISQRYNKYRDPHAKLPQELDALDQLVSRKVIAERVGLSPAMISFWFHGRIPISERHAKAVRILLENVVDIIKEKGSAVTLTDSMLAGYEQAIKILDSEFNFKAKPNGKAVIQKTLNEKLTEVMMSDQIKIKPGPC